MVDGPARSPWWGFSAVAVGVFMATLDGSIVNVALPAVRASFGASIGSVEAVVSVYLLVISATLLAAGRLGDVLGRRRVYAGGLLLFTLGSGLCGFAWSLPVLVAARAVQAVGATAMMSMGAAIVTAIFPRERRGQALEGDGRYRNKLQLPFPLTGAHRTLRCSACHSDGVYNGKSALCYSCHRSLYEAQTNQIGRASCRERV